MCLHSCVGICAMYLRLYVYVYVFMHVHVHACIYVWEKYMNLCVYARIYGICVRAFLYFCQVGMYACVNLVICSSMCLCMCAYVSVWMYARMCVCMNVLRYVVYNGFTCAWYVWIHAMHACMYTYNAIDGWKHPLIMWVQCRYYSEERCDIPRSECPASR